MPPCTLRAWLNQFLKNGESVIAGRKQDKVFKDENLIKAIEGIYYDICFYGHTKVHLELLEMGFEVGLKTVRNI